MLRMCRVSILVKNECQDCVGCQLLVKNEC